MARNKGKRPGSTSGSSTQQAGGTKAPDQNGSKIDRGASVETPTTASTSTASATTTNTAAGTAAKASLPAGAASVSTSSAKTAPSAQTPSATVAKTTPSGGRAASVTSASGKPSGQTTSAGTASGRSTSAAGTLSAGDNNTTGTFWPGLLGGLLGGAAIALAASLFWAGGDGDAVATLQSTTADLDSRLTATEGQVGEVGSFAERLAAIEATPVLSGDGGGEVGDLAGRLDAVEQQLALVADAVGQASTTEAADGSSDMIAGLTDRLAVAEQDLAGLKTAIAQATETGQAANDGIAAIQTAIPGIEALIASTGSAAEENGRQAASLGLSVEALNETTERLGGDLGSLSGRVGEAENRLAYMSGEYQRAAAMVVTIGDIDRAISKAEPFEEPFESLVALGQDDAGIGEALSTLQPMAVEGVPTLAGLQSSFGETGSRILLASEGDQTLADKLSGNVLAVINMRPAGAEVEGDDSRAIVARAQAKLSAGDLEGTLGELGALEGTAAESAGGWMADAGARLAADAAIADLRAHAQNLLAKGS